MKTRIVPVLRPLFQEVWATRYHKDPVSLPEEVKISKDEDFDVEAVSNVLDSGDHVVRNGRILTIVDLYNDARDRDFNWLVSFPEELLPKLTKMAASLGKQQAHSDLKSALGIALKNGITDDEIREILKLALVKHTMNS